MIKNLKVLGIAVVAVVALSAVMASFASADNFTAESQPVTLTGAQEGVDAFKVDGGTVECKKVTYHGKLATVTTSTVTITPSYSECTFVGLAATVTTTGCDYLFHINTAAGNTTGTVDIVCEAGKEITVTAPSVGTAKCIVHVPSQSGLGTITYSKVGTGATGELKVNAAITTLKYSQTAGEGLGKCASALNTTNGIYNGNAIVTGENVEGTFKHIGLGLE